MKIKVNDKVRVVSGAQKGKEGKVTQVFSGVEKVIVEGVNMRTKHLRGRGGNGGQKGQKIEFAAPMHISNVQIIGSNGSVGRVGYKFLTVNEKKQKVRVLRKAKKSDDIA